MLQPSDNFTLFFNWTSAQNETSQAAESLLKWYIVAIEVVGILSNVVTSCILLLVRTPKDSWLYLLFISAADITFLLALAALQIRHNFAARWNSDVFCKLDMFFSYWSSAFSVWLWLLLTFERGRKLFNPLRHLGTANLPPMANVALIACFVAIFESWVLWLISDSPNVDESCSISAVALSENAYECLALTEAILSYFLPFLLVLIINFSVLRKVYFGDRKSSHFLAINEGQITHNLRQCLRQKRKRSALWQTLLFGLLDLMLNLPNQLMRLLFYHYASNSVLQEISAVSYALFYGQYLLNIFYVYFLVYGKLPKSKTVSRYRHKSSTTSTPALTKKSSKDV